LASAEAAGRRVLAPFFGSGADLRDITRLVEEGAGPVFLRNLGHFKRIDNHNG
jgi:hypothetical protein